MNYLQKGECCEKCIVIRGHKDPKEYAYCGNPACACHQPKCCENCLLRNMVKPQCGNFGCSCHQPNCCGECGSDVRPGKCWNASCLCHKSAEKQHIYNLLNDPDIIRRAAEAGANDQNEMLARAGKECICPYLPWPHIHTGKYAPFKSPTTDTAEKNTARCDKCFVGDLHKARQFECLGGKCGCPCPKPTTDTGDWRERFDEQYQSFQLCEVVNKRDFDRLKAFIAKEIERTKKDGYLVTKNIYEAVRKEGYATGKEEGRQEALTELPALQGEDGKLISRVIAKAMEAPFVEVALQHTVMRVAEKYEKVGQATERASLREIIEGMKRDVSEFESMKAAIDYGKLDDLSVYAKDVGYNAALSDILITLSTDK